MKYSKPILKSQLKLQSFSPSENEKTGLLIHQISQSKLEGIKHWINELMRGKIPYTQALEFFKGELKNGSLTPQEFDTAEILLNRSYAAAENEKQQREYIKNLVQTASGNGYKPAWIYHQFLRRYPQPSLKTLQYLGEKLGYSRGWASVQLLKIRGLNHYD